MCRTIQYRWKCGHDTYAYTEACSCPDTGDCILSTKTFDKSDAPKTKQCMPCRARHKREAKEHRKELAKMYEEELKERKKVQYKVWYDKKREKEREEKLRVESKLKTGDDGL